MHNEEAISKAVAAITPLVTNETQAWNLWNSLNSSPAFIEAFLLFHGKLPEATEELVDDAVWEELEEALEGPLKLDLNIHEDNREFSELVKRITDRVMKNLKGELTQP